MNTSLIFSIILITIFVLIHVWLIKTDKIGKGLPFLYATILFPVILINLVLTATLVRKTDKVQSTTQSLITREQLKEELRDSRPDSDVDQLNQIEDSLSSINDKVNDLWIAQ